MSKYIIVVLVCMGLTLSGCGGGGGDGGPPPDPCAGGPVPCFYEDWGLWGYEFFGRETRLFFDVYSNGEYAEVWYEVYSYPFIAQGAGGSDIAGCYRFSLSDYGEIWWKCPPEVPVCGYYLYVWEGGASGTIEICKEELRISDVIILGEVWGSEIADYSGKVSLAIEGEAVGPVGPGRLLRDKLLE